MAACRLDASHRAKPKTATRPGTGQQLKLTLGLRCLQRGPTQTCRAYAPSPRLRSKFRTARRRQGRHNRAPAGHTATFPDSAGKTGAALATLQPCVFFDRPVLGCAVHVIDSDLARHYPVQACCSRQRRSAASRTSGQHLRITSGAGVADGQMHTLACHLHERQRPVQPFGYELMYLRAGWFHSHLVTSILVIAFGSPPPLAGDSSSRAC